VTRDEQIWLYNEAFNYLKGKGVLQDLEKSFALNAQAARAGHRDAVLAMGWHYFGGVGVPVSYEKSRKWYQKSARHGDPRAMFSLGQIAYLERDFTESLTWFRRATQAGHVRSFYWIGKHYWYGHGISKNKKEAMRFFHLAADKKVVEARRVLKFLSRRENNARPVRDCHP
jgi:TPR repeat protein